jgi:nitrate reductase assembly molybdenum cofactor insertion protein NarJ
VHDALEPVARKMLAALEEARHPWADVLAALVEAVEAPRADPEEVAS